MYEINFVTWVADLLRLFLSENSLNLTNWWCQLGSFFFCLYPNLIISFHETCLFQTAITPTSPEIQVTNYIKDRSLLLCCNYNQKTSRTHKGISGRPDNVINVSHNICCLNELQQVKHLFFKLPFVVHWRGRLTLLYSFMCQA